MRDIIRKKATVSSVVVDHDDKLVTIKFDDNQTEVLLITELVRIYDTANFAKLDVSEIEVGSIVSIYHRENTPMMMSMPPKYVPELIVVNNNEDFMSHKFMYFDQQLISADSEIQISDDFLRLVESIEYRPLIKELLVDQELLVFYQKSTKSLPAQVYPEKIIIL